MEVHLETRGSARSTGYRFLGSAPGTAWWRRYAERTAFEYPTILVQRDAAGWRAYLSGIPSSRREPGGSTNRVTIVLDAPAGSPTTDDDRDLTLRLVAAWLNDAVHEQEPSAGALQQALDGQLPEKEVARLYTDAAPGEIAARVRAAAAGLPAVALGDAPVREPGPSWIAPARSDDARAAFLRRVRTLLSDADADADADGAAVLVNLVDDAESYALDAAEPPTVVLSTDPDGRMADELTPLIEKKAPAPRSTPHEADRPWRFPIRTVAAVLMAVAVLAIVVWGVTTAGEKTPSSTPTTTPIPTPEPGPSPARSPAQGPQPGSTPSPSPGPGPSPATSPTPASGPSG